MKKIFSAFFIILFFSFICNSAFAQSLKASASYDDILSGFFGTWHVTSKLHTSTNYSMFNKLSVDIWNLSGYDNVLILENALTGAISNIKIENANENLDGKTLKFTRIKEFEEGGFKYRHTETPEFTLSGNIFKGFDTFKVEKFTKNNELISVDVVKYKVVGQKIAGEQIGR